VSILEARRSRPTDSPRDDSSFCPMTAGEMLPVSSRVIGAEWLVKDDDQSLDAGSSELGHEFHSVVDGDVSDVPRELH
jgi:hypothetical protein